MFRRIQNRLPAIFQPGSPTAGRQLGWLCGMAAIVILLVGLWPLRLRAPNNVSWLAESDGLHFPGEEATSAYDPGGVALTSQPLVAPPETSVIAGELTIELRVRPAIEPGSARGRILSVCDAVDRELFYVGQWTTQLLLMIHRSDAKGKAAFQELYAANAMHTNQTRFVTVTSGSAGTSIYLDGQLAKQYPNTVLLPPSESFLNKRLYLGNAPDGNAPWAGDFLGLAIYGQVLTRQQVRESQAWWSQREQSRHPLQTKLIALYDFNARSGRWITNHTSAANRLFLPVNLDFKKEVLAPLDFSAHGQGDVLLNVFGFVPFGYLFASWLWRTKRRPQWQALIISLALGAALSMIIELVQIYIPMRNSSSTDLACNALGMLLGSLLILAKL